MRYLLSLILLLVFVVPANAVIFIGGTSAAAGGGCSTSTDTKLVDGVTSTSGNTVSVYAGQKITIANQSDITEYMMRVCDNSGADTGNLAVSLWTHDAGNDNPGSEIAGTKQTLAASAMTDCATYTDEIVTLSVVHENLASGTYWLVAYEEASAVLLRAVDTYDSGSRLCTDADGSAGAWDSCLTNEKMAYEVWGCE